jgi:hypothetical protein
MHVKSTTYNHKKILRSWIYFCSCLVKAIAKQHDIFFISNACSQCYQTYQATPIMIYSYSCYHVLMCGLMQVFMLKALATPLTPRQHRFSSSDRCHPTMFFLCFCMYTKLEYAYDNRCFLQGKQTNSTCAINFLLKIILTWTNGIVQPQKIILTYPINLVKGGSIKKMMFLRNNNCKTIQCKIASLFLFGFLSSRLPPLWTCSLSKESIWFFLLIIFEVVLNTLAISLPLFKHYNNSHKGPINKVLV